MFKMDVSLMLLQPRVHGMACLPNVDHATLAGDSVYTWYPYSYLVFDRPKETKYFSGRQAYSFYVVPGQYPADTVEYSTDIGQEGD
jgi:hypothetical protein